MDDIICNDIMGEISRTSKIRHPICNAQTDLFRVAKAEGRPPNRQYAVIRSMVRDMDLESFNV